MSVCAALWSLLNGTWGRGWDERRLNTEKEEPMSGPVDLFVLLYLLVDLLVGLLASFALLGVWLARRTPSKAAHDDRCDPAVAMTRWPSCSCRCWRRGWIHRWWWSLVTVMMIRRRPRRRRRRCIGPGGDGDHRTFRTRTAAASAPWMMATLWLLLCLYKKLRKTNK